MTIDEPQKFDDPDVPDDGAEAPFEGDPFFELGIAPSIVDDIAAQGLTVPTPIQRDAIPVILEGRDLIGLAQTGTGKTAAYLLPLLHGLLQKRKASTPRSTSILVLVPTREHLPGVGQHQGVFRQSEGALSDHRRRRTATTSSVR